MEQSQIEDWKETLSAILTNPDQSQVNTLASQLGEKLLQEKNDKVAALACFIVAEDTERAVEMWVDEAKERLRKKPAAYLKELARVVFKSIMLKAVVGNTNSNAVLEKLTAELVRSGISGNADLAKTFIEKLPIDHMEIFELKALYDRIMGSLKLPRPLLWEAEAPPRIKPSQKQGKPAEAVNPFTGKAAPPGKPGIPARQVNPFPGMPDKQQFGIAKSPFAGGEKEEAKESIPNIPKTGAFKRAGDAQKEANPIMPPVKVAPPPLIPVNKPVSGPQPPVARPEDPNRPKTSPFGEIPERAAAPDFPQQKPGPPKPLPANPAPFQPPSLPDIPKTGVAQPMKTAPPPPLAAVAVKQVQPVYRPPTARTEPAPVSAMSSHSLPPQYSLIYQVWSQVPNAAYVMGNPRLKAEAEAKLEDLFRKVESGELGAAEADRVLAMTQAFNSGDLQSALSIQMELVKSAWEANKSWLPVVKNLIKAKQQSR